MPRNLLWIRRQDSNLSYRGQSAMSYPLDEAGVANSLVGPGNFEIPRYRLKGGCSASELRARVSESDWCASPESNRYALEAARFKGAASAVPPEAQDNGGSRRSRTFNPPIKSRELCQLS